VGANWALFSRVTTENDGPLGRSGLAVGRHYLSLLWRIPDELAKCKYARAADRFDPPGEVSSPAMGIQEIQVQVQQLLDDATTVLNSPSQEGLDELAQAAAAISERRGEEFDSAAQLYRGGNSEDAVTTLRSAMQLAEEWSNNLSRM
jgi:hypothetical protein